MSQDCQPGKLFRAESRALWVNVLPAAQWALNTAFCERYRNTPYCVMFERAPRTAFSALVSATDGEWKIDVMNAEAVRN